jgi:hypothetical protein
VKDLSSDQTLVEVCAFRVDPDARAMMRFRAQAGSVVEEQVLLEGRSEDFEGHDPVHGGQQFWCSDAPKTDATAARRLASVNTCIVVADADPPARIIDIEPRGLFPGPGLSTGYALRLEILHPGVLHVVDDEECRAKVLGRAIPDGGLAAHASWAELEVL